MIVAMLVVLTIMAIADVAALVRIWPVESASPLPTLRQDSVRSGVDTVRRRADMAARRDTAAARDTSSRGDTATAARPPSAQGLGASAGAGALEDFLRGERRILAIAVLAGILGGLVHSIRSLYWYIGNRYLVYSWLPMYLMVPLVSGMMGAVFFFLIKAGFVTTAAPSTALSPAGFAAFSVLVGIFTPQAVEKLKQVAETVFTKAPKGADTAPQSRQ